jgi:hypothetical protein
MHGGGFDAGHLALGLFRDLDLETLAFTPAQIHAQQHLRPVLRLGATGAGLHIDVGIVGVGLAAEHALEFQPLHLGFETLHIRCQRGGGGLVVFQLDQLGQFERVGDAARQLADAADDVFQTRPLAIEFLRALGVFPDLGVFELAQDFGQALLAGIEVKDTPVGFPPALPNPSGYVAGC